MDTLGRWMAHYIAELINVAENSSEEEKRVKERACCDAIVNFWVHRQELARSNPPFSEIQPLLRLLESLDVNQQARYYAGVWRSREREDVNEENRTYFELIEGLDETARILIRYFVVEAAKKVVNLSSDWVGLVEKAFPENIDTSFIRFIENDIESVNGDTDDEIAKKIMNARIEKLELFADLAKQTATGLKAVMLGDTNTQSSAESVSSDYGNEGDLS